MTVHPPIESRCSHGPEAADPVAQVRLDLELDPHLWHRIKVLGLLEGETDDLAILRRALRRGLDDLLGRHLAELEPGQPVRWHRTPEH